MTTVNSNTATGLKRFLIRICIFLLILFVIDAGLGKLLRHFYFKQSSGVDYETNYAINKANEDFLIFGSSRASHHYYPPVLEKKLQLSCYNLGRNGNFILYSEAILQAVLQRHTPKYIVLDIVQHEFEKYPASYDQLACLLPYYKDHPELRSTIKLRGMFEPVKLVSSIYPFNSSVVSVALGNTASRKNNEFIKGYGPLLRAITDSVQTLVNKNDYKIDTIKTKAFQRFIDSCKSRKIALVVTVSPYFDKFSNEDQSITICRRMAEENGIPFWNYSDDALYQGIGAHFYDKDHLNDAAAIRFTEKLADRLLQSK
jgi:hypothetical protein